MMAPGSTPNPANAAGLEADNGGDTRSDWHASDRSGLTEAYAAGLSQRLPLLYCVVMFNATLLALNFRHVAPWWLLVVHPLGIVVALNRALYWRPSQIARRPAETVRRDVARVPALGGALSLAFEIWCLALYPYGTAEQHTVLLLTLTVTMISGILGLIHAPRTALWIAATCMVPGPLFFFVEGDPNAVWIALIQMVVSAILVVVTYGQHDSFARAEKSRLQLARRERQAARLAQKHYRHATIDSLTGALNRRSILSRLDRHLDDHAETAPWLALLDLDGFKLINDTYGHAAGDDVLRTVSNRIATGPGVLAHGRLGGDEFAILLDGLLGAQGVQAACRDLIAAISEPITSGPSTLRLCASIGLHRASGEDVRTCLERADRALYKAKEQRDGAVVLFGPEDEAALQERLAVTRQFNDCVLEDSIGLLYQPIVDDRDGKIIRLGTYARWSPDGQNWFTPSRFMAIADATGRTGELTRMILTRALEECNPAQTGIGIAIKLAPRDVIRQGAVDALAAIVARAGTVPAMVTLEVTERALQIDQRQAAEQLRAFAQVGFRIALDEFGAGWSNLAALRALAIDQFTIDRKLSAALVDEAGARAMAAMIVTLAWQLGIDCTVAGIETTAQRDVARSLGVSTMQGFLFGRPEPAAVILPKVLRAVA
ncbi:putative bifunctional diguanylate cyclase/phosphodiesterase [Novosphingobium sp.]|uniref:putative bifunctional diguanylate cyclase/phosphodiesterase n=1 Tax=Novosphingobium sp. TaxID=1874826 RepID=UPI0038BC915A